MAKSKEAFTYVIARPWDSSKPVSDSDNMCIYSYYTELHRGTRKAAQELLDYVQGQVEDEGTGHQYKIYRVTFTEEPT